VKELRIGPFQTGFTLRDASFEWTNRQSFSVAAIENGVPITWSGGDPASGYVVISATLIRQHGYEDEDLSSLTCVEKVEERSFTLPRSLLRSAASADRMDVRVGYVFLHRFQVPGVEFAEFNYSVARTARIPLK
jgi:hypothetical protein